MIEAFGTRTLFSLVVAWFCGNLASQGSVESSDRNAQIVQNMSRKDRFADFWIYGDLEAGFARAKKTGKPLLVTYRCVP